MAYEWKIEDANEGAARMSMLLWGESGCGKTTLACTAPGKKLLVLFDPDGAASVKSASDVKVLDTTLASVSDIFSQIKSSKPFGLTEVIQEYDTLIIDSLTKVSDLCLWQIANLSLAKGATPDNPTIAGYGMRNRMVMNFIDNMIKLTQMHNKHLILITHEGAAEKNDSGSVISVGMMLGGQLPNLTTKDISECWHMYDTQGKKRIAIRPERLRSPMKTRMFDLSSNKTGFEWKYNPSTNDGFTIKNAWESWKNGKYAKIQIPL